MTKLLYRALKAARTLPPDLQDEIARVVLALADGEGAVPVELSAEERVAISDSKAAAARGEFATDDEVRGVWTKPGL